MHPPKYPRTPYLPFSPSIDDDRKKLVINPAEFVNRQVVITEKIDGSNVALWNGVAYSRSTSSPSEAAWHAMVKKHHAWKTNGMGTIFYGEDIFGIHSIEYQPVPEDETFYVFALRKDTKFCSWLETMSTCLTYRFKLVPELYSGKIKNVKELENMISEFHEQESVLGGCREGIVIRLAGEFGVDSFSHSIAKSVRPNHVQTDHHWTRNWRPCKIKIEK